MDRQPLLLLWKYVVRPVLEYGSAFRNPCKSKNIDTIEYAQAERRFTKPMNETEDLPKANGWTKLTFIVIHSDQQLIQVHKLLHNLYDADFANLFQRSVYESIRRNLILWSCSQFVHIFYLDHVSSGE